MKKRVLSVILSAVMLTATGCADKKDSDGKAKETAPVFFQRNHIQYGNGAVFGEEPALFIDFDTMEKSALCAVPNCNHQYSECLAQAVGNAPVFYNDYVYYFDSNNGEIIETPEGRELFIESKLMKASLESSEAEEVCVFNDCAPVQGFPGYVLYGNELYFTADDLNPKEGIDGNGVGGWGTSGGYHFICSINLDTGEYTNYGSIYDGDKQYDGAEYSSSANISGVYNDTMYIAYNFIKDNEALQNGEDLDEIYTDLCFEFDFETKTWKESPLPYSRYMNNNTYTYYDRDTKKMHILHEKGELLIDSDYPIVVLSEVGGKLFIPDTINSENGKWYDLSDNSEHSMGKYSGYEAIGYHDGCYILIKGGRNVKLTEEELFALDKEE